ncbi:MAG: methionyl-tRNA formyltransferase [Candidatus Doudnabacteria bacterium RIFCSPLOWO2_02_FULL_49_13]|uniref:Methionyl-tRNA formyltransferase n=1 Tax=Candidatus Doudnabacteria bacterium RIFCSPHIGHO2_12_FULL_48_16 TaxID=1817838 RepID=A0A1F5PKU8_9BACT|nr:MAG: methionyl-tRNA formyltransferase [Candidatus Doudnabacteria bacterium RIFCSPHIGHO2_02_FULL_49_24]OGE89094.1 MAG: methionyl-tRNA formyltransferase [Candidatus Doudnabacteria bacterium RIFCSPHIGHO2_01_FULL_50_67]OGE90575.1 MAG: methionyl-tRNA formyltransferase [Candidatus Doudnabacteria bacterium RIFCSPHIGHO2_12_FULL_48_16]OGE97612.1 MAG: methionyl-tRNA formyltransferase [Candidatus Doudnabacteria bacterium RIFCSPLOWO2_01_FULL_49_40]OGF02967.1 MAG: methionyl-tRNA formyltransferase [Candid
MLKIIFAGTTEFGIPTLEKLSAKGGSLPAGQAGASGGKTPFEIVLIITQPDKPAGRDRRLTPPPIKVWALKNGIPVEQPEKIYNLKSIISNLSPDLLLVAAYGQILPQAILDLPKFGSINIHGSVLPKYRGATPIQATILNGDKSAGITLIQMDEKMDHGDILAIRTMALTGRETLPELYHSLSLLSAELVSEALTNLVAGRLSRQPQNHLEASYTKMLTRDDGKIDWARSAAEIDRKIRAYNPEPGTWTTLGGKLVKILEVEIISDHKIELPGKLYGTGEGLAVKCVDNSLLLKKVKPEGKNEMTGKDYLNGLQSLNNKLFL